MEPGARQVRIMWWHRLTVAGALIVIGCAAPGASLVQTVPPGSGSPSVAPTSASTPAPTPSAEPTSITGHMSPRERSDWFWEGVSAFGRYGFTYDSLAEITKDSHLVVLGRIVDTQRGQLESFEAPPEESGIGSTHNVIFGVVAVDEVLKGEPEMKVAGQVLVARTGLPDLAAADLPQGQVLLFLKNYAQLREDEGVGPSSDADDRFYYSRANGYQCVLRDINGTTRIVDGPRGWEEALGPFPSQLDGRPFHEVLDRVRALAAGM